MRSTPILITGIELSDGVRKSTRLQHIEQAKIAIECEIQEMNRLWLEHAMEAKLDEKNEGSSQIPDPKGYMYDNLACALLDLPITPQSQW